MIAALNVSGAVEAVAGMILRLSARVVADDTPAGSVLIGNASAIQAAATLAANVTLHDDALQHFLDAGGLSPLLSLLSRATSFEAGAVGFDLAESVAGSIASALCSLAVSRVGTTALLELYAETQLLRALQWLCVCIVSSTYSGRDTGRASPVPRVVELAESLSWALCGVAAALKESAASDDVARVRFDALLEQGVPILRNFISCIEGSSSMCDALARVRTLVHGWDLERG